MRSSRVALLCVLACSSNLLSVLCLYIHLEVSRTGIASPPSPPMMSRQRASVLPSLARQPSLSASTPAAASRLAPPPTPRRLICILPPACHRRTHTPAAAFPPPPLAHHVAHPQRLAACAGPLGGRVGVLELGCPARCQAVADADRLPHKGPNHLQRKLDSASGHRGGQACVRIGNRVRQSH